LVAGSPRCRRCISYLQHFGCLQDGISIAF